MGQVVFIIGTIICSLLAAALSEWTGIPFIVCGVFIVVVVGGALGGLANSS